MANTRNPRQQRIDNSPQQVDWGSVLFYVEKQKEAAEETGKLLERRLQVLSDILALVVVTKGGKDNKVNLTKANQEKVLNGNFGSVRWEVDEEDGSIEVFVESVEEPATPTPEEE